MINENFFFHESFPPQTLYLSELLKIASEEFCGTKYEISEITGIPTGEKSGKVEPHIKYLEYMGIVESSLSLGKISLSLTELGKVVYNEDQYLMNNATKQLLNYNLTRLQEGAPQWGYFFRTYPYEYDIPISFTLISDKGKMTYGKEVYLGPLKSMYTTGDFECISPIEFEGKNVIFKSCYVNYECNKIYGYTLIKELESRKIDNDEVTLNILLDEIKWQKGFGFDYDTVLEVLDELNHMGIIKLNKQLNPMTIILNRKSDDIITELYDSLI